MAARSTSGCLCSRFGTVSLKCRIASGNVMSSVPLGSTIRVSKRRRRDVVKVPARPRPLLVERPLPICKVVYGPPSMQCLPARFAIEAPACHDRPPYLDSAVKRPAKQATKKDAHWSSIPGRSAPRALGQLGRHSKKGSLYLGNSGQIFVSSRQRRPSVAMRRDGPRVQ